VVRIKHKIAENYKNLGQEEKQELLSNGIDEKAYARKELRGLYSGLRSLSQESIHTLHI